MKLRFYLSGSIMYETEASVAPAPGDRVTFIVQHYKKGIKPGTLVTARVLGDAVPRTFDFTDSDELVVALDIDEIEAHGSE